MPEAFSWMEGQVWMSTGLPFATSAYIGLAESTQSNLQVGWVNTPAAGGVYHNHTTGQKVDVTIGTMYSYDKTAQQWFDTKTAVHMKFIHSSVNGTAGIFLYSGRIASVNVQGSNGQVFKQSMQAFFNNWSAF